MTRYTPERVNDVLCSRGITHVLCKEVNSFTKKDSVFVDTEFGEFTHSVKNVLMKGGCHPDRRASDRKNRILREKKPNADVKDIADRVVAAVPGVRLIPESYRGVMQDARFIDEEFGEFTRRVRDVLRRRMRHPRFHELLRSDAAKKRRESAMNSWREKHGTVSPFHSKEIQHKCKESVAEKYGVKSIGENPEIQRRIRATNLDRYGYEYLFQDADFRKKCFDISVENGRCAESNQEKQLREFFLSHGITGKKRRFWSDVRGKYLELDFVCEERKFAVEMNGLYYHSEKFLDKKYHKDKMDLARQNGLKLIMIWDYEWRSKRKQVENFLLSTAGLNPIKIGARKTVCRVVNKEDATEFLEENHIQGKVSFKNAYGLYFEERLVMLITIGNHHRRSSEMVLSRMCAAKGVTVAGGFSKLCAEALKEHQTLTSWVDLRISDGRSYSASGWKEIAVLGPDYFYTDHRKMISKQSRKKSNVNTPPGMSEREHAERDGLLRVWDCGKKKFILSAVHV